MTDTTKPRGHLYLIPVGIALVAPESFLPAATIQTILSLDTFIVENSRTARRFLRSVGYLRKFDEVNFFVIDKHNSEEGTTEFLAAALNGQHTGLLSEAGLPCVADPGSKIVAAAHSLGIKVIPLSGTSSILLALAASGFNGQEFAFNGYLPVKPNDRIKKIRELELVAAKTGQTQIFIETPYRNRQLINSLTATCLSSTWLCIACNIGAPDEYILTRRIREWSNKLPPIDDKSTVFLISA